MVGEGKFNLNVLRETKVTDSFLGLDMEDRGCQNDEPVQNCTTRQYIETVLDKCNCVPLNLRLKNNVKNYSIYLNVKLILFLGICLHF